MSGFYLSVRKDYNLPPLVKHIFAPIDREDIRIFDKIRDKIETLYLLLPSKVAVRSIRLLPMI